MKITLTKIKDPKGRWEVLAKPGVDRFTDGRVLWSGTEEPSTTLLRMIFEAVNYGCQVTSNAARVYVDSAIYTADESDRNEDTIP